MMIPNLIFRYEIWRSGIAPSLDPMVLLEEESPWERGGVPSFLHSRIHMEISLQAKGESTSLTSQSWQENQCEFESVNKEGS